MPAQDIKTPALAAAAVAAVVAGVVKLRDNYVVNRRLATIEEAIEEFRRGRPLIVMDDEDRENEGDLIAPAHLITEEIVSMIVNETTGILCTPMPEERANSLGLHPMTTHNTDPKGTAYTITTDLKPEVPLSSKLRGTAIAGDDCVTGVTTGVSAHDRMKTFRALAHADACPTDFSRPGHVFPLRARSGGVATRRGHTEATVDLCRLAHVPQVGVIGELVNKDGSMKRFHDCKRFGFQHNLLVITIDALANYLYRKPLPLIVPKTSVVKVAECLIPMTRGGQFLGVWKMICFKEMGKYEHIVMVLGDVSQANTEVKKIPVRVHSECFTGDLMGSMRCDCGEQLDTSFKHVHDHGVGVVIYMTGHEGRGIGLVNKMHAYQLQSQGLDTYRANRELGFEDDLRSFDACVDIVRLLDMRGKTVQLLTNSPLKSKCMAALKGYAAVETVPLLCEHNEYNSRYLTDKRNHESRLREGGLASKPERIGASLRLSDRAHLAVIPKVTVVIIRTVWFGVPLKALQNQIVAALVDASVPHANIGEVLVPGAAHLPYAAKTIAATGEVDAVLCLGITMKGDLVPHAFACMSSSVANGLTLAQIQQGTPILYGVLACEHKQQVVDRCSAGTELAYGLALSTLQVAVNHCMLHPKTRKPNSLPCFPKLDSALPCSPVSAMMRQSVAAHATQAEELSSKVVLPDDALAAKLKIAIICTAWHTETVDTIAADVAKTLRNHGIQDSNITYIRVAGSFEIPYAAQLAARCQVDAVVTVGVLLKGEDAHFEYVSLSEALGIVDVQLKYDVPVVSGVLLCLTEEHLEMRAKESPIPLALSVLHQATLGHEVARAPKPKTNAKPFSFGRVPDKTVQLPLTDILNRPVPAEAKALKIGIIRTAWNENMVTALRDEILVLLQQAGVSLSNVSDRIVPGSYELPMGAQMLCEAEDVDAVLCLGVLIKGDTKHFEYICQATSYSLLHAQDATGVPMLFGVQTCYSVEQAKDAVTKGSGLHETLASSLLHQALLKKKADGLHLKKETPRLCSSPEPVETRELPPSDLRAALMGELVKDIPRTLQAPAPSVAQDMSIALVATSDEEVELVQQMVDGITAVFDAAGLPKANVVVQWVPTSFDLSHAVARILKQTNVLAVLAVGVLIEESNTSFDTSCEAASFGLLEASLLHKVPVLFGVLTCLTREQARARAEKGSELHYSLAMSALHMACMRRQLGLRAGPSQLPGPQPAAGERLARVSAAQAAAFRVCLVRTSWNENEVLSVVDVLRGQLLDAGVKVSNILEEVVPGTYELPFTARQIAQSHTCDVVCLLGTMVRGDVANFQYMAAASIRGFTVVGMEELVPIVWGVKCVEDQLELSSVAPGEIELLTTRILQAASAHQPSR
ncbi:Riboflavin biosynthesis protein RibBA [Diplonema papillatum]|nr:Riboflavin biosynthesis protein RibBA [Diplonema papillatum]